MKRKIFFDDRTDVTELDICAEIDSIYSSVWCAGFQDIEYWDVDLHDDEEYTYHYFYHYDPDFFDEEHLNRAIENNKIDVSTKRNCHVLHYLMNSHSFELDEHQRYLASVYGHNVQYDLSEHEKEHILTLLKEEGILFVLSRSIKALATFHYNVVTKALDLFKAASVNDVKCVTVCQKDMLHDVMFDIQINDDLLHVAIDKGTKNNWTVFCVWED